MMLSVQKRIESDDRSLGEFFYSFTHKMADISWIYAINLLIQTFCKQSSKMHTFLPQSAQFLSDGFMMIETLVVTGHINNFTVMNQPVKDKLRE